MKLPNPSDLWPQDLAIIDKSKVIQRDVQRELWWDWSFDKKWGYCCAQLAYLEDTPWQYKFAMILTCGNKPLE